MCDHSAGSKLMGSCGIGHLAAGWPSCVRAWPWRVSPAVLPVLGPPVHYKRRPSRQIFKLNLALPARSALSILGESCKPFFAWQS